MPIENSHNSYPATAEVLKPKEHLFVASANAIDQRGRKIAVDGNDKDVYNAEWTSSLLDRSFKLQQQVFLDQMNSTTYFLDVYGYSSTELIARYQYNLKEYHIYMGTERLRKVKRKDSDQVISTLLKYLSSSTQLTDEEEEVFLGIMAQDGGPDMRPKQRIRRFARGVLESSGQGLQHYL